jgi:hypothetical protein
VAHPPGWPGWRLAEWRPAEVVVVEGAEEGVEEGVEEGAGEAALEGFSRLLGRRWEQLQLPQVQVQAQAAPLRELEAGAALPAHHRPWCRQP